MDIENEKLTGRTRYRIQKFTQKLILQVEEQFNTCIPCGQSFDFREGCRWRDATVEDLTVINN